VKDLYIKRQLLFKRGFWVVNTAPLVQRQRHVCLLASTNIGSGSGDAIWLAIC
jgi:hypothetical protein